MDTATVVLIIAGVLILLLWKGGFFTKSEPVVLHDTTTIKDKPRGNVAEEAGDLAGALAQGGVEKLKKAWNL